MKKCRTAHLPRFGFSVLFFLTQTLFGAAPSNWTECAPNTETLAARGLAPRFFRDGEALSLELKTKDSVAYWSGTLPVNPESGCRITCEALTCGISDAAGPSSVPGNDCMVLLSWQNPAKKNPDQRDYLDFTDAPTDQPGQNVRHFDGTFAVPEGCSELKIELVFRWRKGTARFQKFQALEVPRPAPRPVRVVAANPHPARTMAGNLNAMEETLNRIFAEVEAPDLILFAECFTDSGTGTPLSEAAEPLPGGPTFQLLSRYAKAHHVWLAGSIHEVTEAGVYHNSAFLVNRNGELAGVYRKVHLTVTESLKGVTPGEELPVFETDFGKIAFVVCWDNWFSETAKRLRLKGAELLLFPLAGDGKESHWSKIWSARAIDSAIPMITVTQQAHLPSAIIDRDGEWLAQTTEKNGFVWKELNLNERKRSFWLSVGPSMGDPYQLYLHERRPEAYQK